MNSRRRAIRIEPMKVIPMPSKEDYQLFEELGKERLIRLGYRGVVQRIHAAMIGG